MFLTCIRQMPMLNVGQFTGYPQFFRCSPLSTIQTNSWTAPCSRSQSFSPPKILKFINYYHVKIYMYISNYLRWKHEISPRRRQKLTYLNSEVFEFSCLIERTKGVLKCMLQIAGLNSAGWWQTNHVYFKNWRQMCKTTVVFIGLLPARYNDVSRLNP
jgi:hypothetical protein